MNRIRVKKYLQFAAAGAALFVASARALAQDSSYDSTGGGGTPISFSGYVNTNGGDSWIFNANGPGSPFTDTPLQINSSGTNVLSVFGPLAGGSAVTEVVTAPEPTSISVILLGGVCFYMTRTFRRQTRA